MARVNGARRLLGGLPQDPGGLQALVELAGSQLPASVVMFSGAGVSTEGPASLPTGQELAERVFGAYFTPGTLATVLRHHAAVGWQAQVPCPRDPSPAAGPEPRRPRLETVLGVVAAAYGYQAVADVLADMRAAAPNRLHRFFAAHLGRGGRQITANFDACIEHAADGLPLGRLGSRRILHFHGTLADGPSAGDLGATLGQIQGGFKEAQAARFLQMLPTDGILAVLGYSGSDFFDVDTTVASLEPGALARLLVIWISHSDHSWHLIDPAARTEPPLAGLFRRAGAHVDTWCGATGEFIQNLSRAWAFGDIGPPQERQPHPPDVTAPGDAQRQAATFMLYRELGLHDEIGPLLDAGTLTGVDPAAIWWARSELLWEQGRWGTLRRLWRHGDVPATIRRAARSERIGACLWVQGRLLPAYLWLTCHRRRCRDRDDRLMLAETEGRVVEHMARVPELRLLARVLAPGLIRELGDTGQTAGIHTYRRRNDLASSLRSLNGEPRAATEAATSSQWFTEAGNLLAALSYLHRQYRDTYDPANIRDAELSRRYRELQARYRSVGSPSGYWRTHLLPGAERVFTTTEVIRGVFALQHGWWHRVRLLVRYLPLRIPYLLRTRRTTAVRAVSRSRAANRASDRRQPEDLTKL